MVILFMSSLTGCWDQLELEEQAFITVIGVDMAADNRYSITYQIAGPGGGGLSNITGSSPNLPTSEVVTFVVPDLISARNLASISVTRRPSFAHTSNIVVSEEVARSDQFYDLLASAVRDRQIRRDSFLIVSKEKAADFIRNNDPKLEARPHKFYNFMSKRWREIGLVPVSNLNKLIQREEAGEDLFLANYGSSIERVNKIGKNEGDYEPGQIQKGGGNPTEIIGSVVIKDGKMIDSLDGESTRICILLRPTLDTNNIQMTFQDPVKKESRVSTELSRNNIKIDMDLKSDPPKINVMVNTDIILLGIPSGIDYVQNLSNQELLRTSIQNELTQLSNTMVKKTQEVYGKSPFNWSLEARKEFLTIDDYKKYDFPNKYKDAKISVSYKVNIKAFGKQLRPPQSKGLKNNE